MTPDFRVTIVSGFFAILALSLTGALGGSIRGPELHARMIAGVGSLGFAVLAVLAVRSLGSELDRVLKPRTGPSHAAVVRWIVIVSGYGIVLLTTLGLLDVPVKHLVLGGALTGVILGIAATQALAMSSPGSSCCWRARSASVTPSD